jgi:hypothetical protein
MVRRGAENLTALSVSSISRRRTGSR